MRQTSFASLVNENDDLNSRWKTASTTARASERALPFLRHRSHTPAPAALTSVRHIKSSGALAPLLIGSLALEGDWRKVRIDRVYPRGSYKSIQPLVFATPWSNFSFRAYYIHIRWLTNFSHWLQLDIAFLPNLWSVATPFAARFTLCSSLFLPRFSAIFYLTLLPSLLPVLPPLLSFFLALASG